ncbi:MAG TPA: hypothetical protein VE135_09095 [Pyrinomonadaceae bacterium]|nr:hypothetical protein [Pyrinomonadaceae bacterium]
MKKQPLKTLAILGLLLTLTAISVSAQSERRINIPFNFIVRQKTLPHGEYTVEAKKNFDKVWLIQSTDNSTCVLVITMPVQASKTPGETKLVFHKYGDQYFLSQIWTTGDNTGRELLMPRLEREFAKGAVKRQPITLTARSKN